MRVRKPAYGDKKLDALYKADLYLHLPRWEVFGMAIIEAAMTGLPLVLSEECDLAADAEAAGAALIVSHGNKGDVSKLAELVKNRVAMREMGDNARKWAMGSFSSEVVAAKSVSYYKNMIDQKTI